MERVKRKRKKKRPVLKWSLIILGLLFLSAIAYGAIVFQSLTSATNEMHEPIDREVSEKRMEEVRFEERDPFSVLLLGVDEREGDSGRSDTMIVMTVNPQTEETKLLSIPRDTYTNIEGRGMDKINHAYAFGGTELAMSTVENMLDIPIDYYVKVNMEGFKDIVDAVDGVTVNNGLEFEAGGYSYPLGELSLNGDEALAYARMRYEDPNGDFGRQERQRQVIQGIIREGASVNSLMNFQDIFQALGSNVKTNLTFNQLVDIQSKYRSAAGSVQQTTLDGGSGQYINDIYYYVVPDEKIAEVQEQLKAELALSSS
ncbi:LCP family glycopolymer transferase [Jeotgalibacillus haloalkalitolerans]|uniref:Polyisoprenyl-teichoic acid--peptidoglycan teichoic acid transferase TagU n=1 Tax=Jeotgalibacillus haloalkalitolerans TaxID=3104292 RepID=A0ABU5KJF5_9BACL|nr:LCP family protein [Jeotgalibacillus sp. HH7-29]MDZ5711302.1 LCP family protein [Jeotgalibacillus sp. HH7-29]